MASGGEVAAGGRVEDTASEDVEHLKCEPCQEDGNLREAVGLCTDCQEYLCQTCFDGHRVPKITRHHRLLDKENMLRGQVKPSKKDRCTEKCHQHEDEVVNYYCTVHSQLICSVCLHSHHGTCKGVLCIPDVARDLTGSNEFKQVESQLVLVLAKSKKLTKLINQNADKFKKSYAWALKMVKDYRKELNDILDTVESKLVEQAETMKSVEMKSIDIVSAKCKEAATELKATQANLEALRKSKQNCNLFTEMMKLKDNLARTDEKLKHIETEQTSAKCGIKFAPNVKTLETFKQTHVFGTFSIKGTRDVFGTSSNKDSDTYTEASARAAVEDEHTVVKAEHIQDINVQTDIDFDDCYITGSVLLPEDRLVIADRSNKCIKTVDTTNGIVTAQLEVQTAPWDLAMVRYNKVAVTLPNDKLLVFVLIAAHMRIDRRLALSGHCHGVDCRNGKLVVSFTSPEQIQVLTLQGRLLHNIKNDKKSSKILQSPFYLSFGRDSTTLFVSNNYSNNVMHIKLDGTMIASYTDTQLQCPENVTVDCHGKVYVCARNTHSIHQLTSDCEKTRVLLCEADGLLDPYTISCSKDGRLFVNTNNTMKVFACILGLD